MPPGPAILAEKYSTSIISIGENLEVSEIGHVEKQSERNFPRAIMSTITQWVPTFVPISCSQFQSSSPVWVEREISLSGPTVLSHRYRQLDKPFIFSPRPGPDDAGLNQTDSDPICVMFVGRVMPAWDWLATTYCTSRRVVSSAAYTRQSDLTGENIEYKTCPSLWRQCNRLPPLPITWLDSFEPAWLDPRSSSSGRDFLANCFDEEVDCEKNC